jgi:hypothetical protein
MTSATSTADFDPTIEVCDDSTDTAVEIYEN